MRFRCDVARTGLHLLRDGDDPLHRIRGSRKQFLRMTAEPAIEERRQGRASAARPGRRYCLVTPCRDEADLIRATLDTITGQTIPPARWIIVDDGSTDATPDIVAEYAARHGYIQLVRRKDRGTRAVGPGVIEAFYEGLRHVDLQDFDYIGKFDADLEMPPRYFERCMERMEADPRLGNISGKFLERHQDGTVTEERVGDENAIGAAKFYRMACFRDIGGFVREVAWDGIDGHICRMCGWIAQSVDDPEMLMVHLRPMGSSQKGIHAGRRRWGRGKYFMGSSWYYVLAASVYRMAERPWVLGGANIFAGYLRAAAARHTRYDNPAYVRHLRRYELEALLTGRRRTLSRYNRRIRERHAGG